MKQKHPTPNIEHPTSNGGGVRGTLDAKLWTSNAEVEDAALSRGWMKPGTSNFER